MDGQGGASGGVTSPASASCSGTRRASSTSVVAGFTAHIHNPRSGYVSLHASIPGVLDQTLIRAYAIR